MLWMKYVSLCLFRECHADGRCCIDLKRKEKKVQEVCYIVILASLKSAGCVGVIWTPNPSKIMITLVF